MTPPIPVPDDPAGRFGTPLTVTGPWRRPAQLLADQLYDGHASVHDEAAAGAMGLAGAPIEGPTHFSQLDPLAHLVWGDRWFTAGCLSCHFRTMVVEGEQVRAGLRTEGPARAAVWAEKEDGTPVLDGTATVGPEAGVTEVERRLDSAGDPGELHIVDRLEPGMRHDSGLVAVTMDEPNGPLYPFSLAQKLAVITEPHPWYTAQGAAGSPWGRPLLPLEMVSVLAHKQGTGFPVRTPSLGLFLDLQVRLIDGPVLAGQPYRVTHEVVGLGQSRRTESFWTRTTLADPGSEEPVAEVLLHSGVFKASYPGYPAGGA